MVTSWHLDLESPLTTLPNVEYSLLPFFILILTASYSMRAPAHILPSLIPLMYKSNSLPQQSRTVLFDVLCRQKMNVLFTFLNSLIALISNEVELNSCCTKLLKSDNVAREQSLSMNCLCAAYSPSNSFSVTVCLIKLSYALLAQQVTNFMMFTLPKKIQ